jgi:hypothetical protein
LRQSLIWASRISCSEIAETSLASHGKNAVEEGIEGADPGDASGSVLEHQCFHSATLYEEPNAAVSAFPLNIEMSAK